MTKTTYPELIDAYLGTDESAWLQSGEDPVVVATALVAELGPGDGWTRAETIEAIVKHLEAHASDLVRAWGSKSTSVSANRVGSDLVRAWLRTHALSYFCDDGQLNSALLVADVRSRFGLGDEWSPLEDTAHPFWDLLISVGEEIDNEKVAV